MIENHLMEQQVLENQVMESLHGLMVSLARLASESFDKQALLQLHDFCYFVLLLKAVAAGDTLRFHLVDPIGSGDAASSVPLERLDPISFTKLEDGEVHHGLVVYGTLCAEAFRRSTDTALRRSRIVTVLEDDDGLAVRLAIYNTASSQMADIKKLYPRGARVAIKEPYFMRASDGSVLILVDNPANVNKLVTQEMLLHLNVEEVRKNGNIFFREQNWDAAAENYTKCIDATLLQLKERLVNDNNKINTGLLQAYSNRAETWLQMKIFKRALEDSDEALPIDPRHLKSLYRKGRALVGLRHYSAACEFLEKADRASPGQREIKDALRHAKTLYAQSRDGKYDISDYLIGRDSSPPEVADFVGPVVIDKTKDGRGQGLYATEDVATGQLLLVSNAIAVVYEDGRSALLKNLNVNNGGKFSTASQEDLVAAVVCAARKSQRLLRQLYSIDVSSSTDSVDVPAIDLFRPEDQMSRGKEKEIFQVDVDRIRDVINRRSFGGASKSERYAARLCRGSNKDFSGFWLLPSFINHSCLPNSTSLEVGSAMFIHASKPIKRGEEITISYFDSLIPLPQREAMCKCWGFKCKCKRCILEQSLRAFLDPITTQFDIFFDKPMDESNTARSPQVQPFEADLPACAKFAKLFVEVELIIRSSPQLKTEEEKKWIRASFVSAYFAGTQSNVFLPTTIEDCVPSGEEIIEATQSTVPGDIRTLVMLAQHLKEAKRWMRDENQSSIIRYIAEQAREACIRVFGKHGEDVLKELVFKHLNFHMF